MVKDRTLSVIMVVFIIVFFFSGCITTDYRQKTANRSDKTGNNTVIAAPLSIFISEGSSQEINYRNRTLLIDYTSATPQHVLEISMDNISRTITIDLNTTCIGGHCQYRQVIDGLQFLIEPVSRNGETWSAQTWDVRELFIELSMQIN